ncbi:MAG: hypothetical protein ABSA23_17220, partial [Anaerolineales bacterium]
MAETDKPLNCFWPESGKPEQLPDGRKQISVEMSCLLDTAKHENVLYRVSSADIEIVFDWCHEPVVEIDPDT